MGKIIEIERKFLVKQEFTDTIINQSEKHEMIIQGYLVKKDGGSMRIRVVVNGNGERSAYLMAKLKQHSVMVNEELTIDLFDYDLALKMMTSFSSSIIRKDRYYLKFEDYIWSVDFFENGVILAEIEIPDENTTFPIPPWVENEVTGQPEYYNANM